MRKSLLLGAGLAVAVAGSVAASERHRESAVAGADESEAIAKAAPSNVRTVGPDTLVASVNGTDVTLHADGSIHLDEVMAAYGSVERMNFDAATASVMSSTAPDGTRLYANGAVGYFHDLLGSSSPQPEPRTVDEFKAVTPWVEKNVDGVTVVAFANGVVLMDSSVSFSEPAWVNHREQIVSKVDENGVRHYADNAIFLEPAFQPKESQ